MCGIFGWQLKKSKLPPIHKRYIVAVALGWQNEKRGVDSWGWYNPTTRALVKGLGRIGPSARAMAPSLSLIGHTRHGTKGEVTIPNAHPFTFGTITGAHNGAIHNHDSLNLKRKEGGLPQFEVDSMHIFDALSKGLDISKLHGYGAIEFVDSNYPDEIVLCRISKTGELSVAQTDCGVFWSSEKDHLLTALAVSGLEGRLMDVTDEQLYFVRDGMFYRWNDKFLKLGEYRSASYGQYGSRMLPKDRADMEAMWADWIDEMRGTNTSGDSTSKFLTKKQRKEMIRHRNDWLNKQKSEKPPYSYKELCKCGAWVGDGELHKSFCPEWETDNWNSGTVVDMTAEDDIEEIEDPDPTPPLIKDLSTKHIDIKPPTNVVSLVDAAKKSAQKSEIQRLEEQTDHLREPERKEPGPKVFDSKGNLLQQGVMLNGEWVCQACYTAPQVWDQHCPQGHGRVVGNVVAGL